MNWRNFLVAVLIAYLIIDISFSFFQYYHTSFDGDMPRVLVPDVAFFPVLNDPLAFKTFITHQVINSPNRYFAIETMRKYFDNTDVFLRKFITI